MSGRFAGSARGSWLALATALLSLLAGCAEQAAGPPSILLVTLDTTRADRLGAYGHEGAITPTLDRLSREGILFEAAIAPTPITLPSHASILTGVQPPVHGVRDNSIFVLAPEAQLVSEVLRERGWRTAAFVGSYVLHPRFGLDQGFEVYRAPEPGPKPSRAVYVERPANQVVDEALAWLSELGAEERFFVWVHFFDPHLPYDPPPGWERRLGNPYDGEIAFCDAQLGRLLRTLKKSGRGRNLLVVVASDHGESLGEHEEESHGVFLYQATLHVPLILAGGPLARTRGTRVAHAVSLVDVPATLLALSGIASEAMPALRSPALVTPTGAPSPAEADRGIYVESLLPYHSFRWHGLRGLVWQQHKLIEGRAPELYALSDDPGERRDRAAEAPQQVERMRELLRELERHHAGLGWGGPRDLEASERDLLHGLGYLAGSAGEDPFDAALPDPHDRIGDIRLISLAEHHIQRAARLRPVVPEDFARQDPNKRARGLELLERARSVLEELRANNPEDPHVFVDLGTVESRLGHHAAAVPLLERAIEFHPADAGLRYHLALSYHATGDAEAARREMRMAQTLDPGNSLYELWLRARAR